jgi:hypothetical protein
MKKVSEDSLSAKEVTKREDNVLKHFLTTPATAHKPIGKGPQAKRRRAERKSKARASDMMSLSELMGDPVTETITFLAMSAKRERLNSKKK